MTASLLAVLISFLGIFPSHQGMEPYILFAQAEIGPTKSGMYVVDVQCPSAGDELVVLQMNQQGQMRRSKSRMVGGNFYDVRIDVSESDYLFEEAFPNGNEFSKSQLELIKTRSIKFLKNIYAEACADDEHKQSQFLSKVKKNALLLRRSD